MHNRLIIGAGRRWHWMSGAALLVSVQLTAFVGLSAAAHAGGDAPPQYLLTELGTLGGDESFARDINNQSQIVGWSYTGENLPPPFDGSPVRQAFIWEDGVMTALPNLVSPEPYSSQAHAISDAGHVVGTSMYSIFFVSHAVMWFDGEVVDMGTLPGEATYCIGRAVNDDGVVAGTCESDFTGSGHGFRWSAQSGMSVMAWPEPNEDANAFDIDAEGRIVGGSYGPTLGAYLWDDGRVTPLFNGPNGAIARAINENGAIVGQNSVSTTASHAHLWIDGVTTDLGTLGGSHSKAHDINEAGWVVGTSGSDAFLWIDGEMHNLGNLISDDSQFNPIAAYAINDKNEIVGYGIDADSNARAFLLRPRSPADFNADGAVDVSDLLLLLAAWGDCPIDNECPADLDQNLVVNVADLLVLLAEWSPS